MPKDPPAKPSQVTLAIIMLVVSLAAGVFNPFLDPNPAIQRLSIQFVVGVLAATEAFLLFLIYKINSGRNWARMIWLIFCVIGAIPYLIGLWAMFGRSTLAGSISLVQWVLQIAALVLLFTRPGSIWFEKRK